MLNKKILKIDIKKTETNINHIAELTGQDSSKKSEKQFLFSSEAQGVGSDLNQKLDNKRAVIIRLEESEKAKNVMVPENRENFAGNIREPLLLDDLLNENIAFPINDEDAIKESDLHPIINILGNNENYNSTSKENPYDENSKFVKYILIEIKDV